MPPIRSGIYLGAHRSRAMGDRRRRSKRRSRVDRGSRGRRHGWVSCGGRRQTPCRQIRVTAPF